jgi:aryl-alcohol dehydrogenase-like predicted oxidoreductase
VERGALSDELRIGLGCMRLSSAEPISAAVAAGITLFDTARAYGDNERLLAGALRSCGAHHKSHIVTKGGMRRPRGAWVPDGRAKAILEDCEASLTALDGLAIDLYLLHAPDPRTPLTTSVRALARLREEGLVREIGLANINRRQLDEALTTTPIAAIQVALSVYDDTAIRGGLLERCAELGIAVIAHSPLGGPKRATRLRHHTTVKQIAARQGITAAQAALAWLLALSPVVTPIPGATRASTAREAAAAARISLPTPEARPRAERRRSGGDVVLVMGIPGAGKTRLAVEYAQRGYVRLNRDERGGRLRALAETLDETLSAGSGRVVLDNTYLTRAARSYVLEVADRHRLPVTCIWIDISLAEAQVNLVERILERCGGELPEPEELRKLSRREPGLLAPTSQMRAVRELEPPSVEEGFAAVERVPFTREPQPDRPVQAVFVAASVLRAPGWQPLVAKANPAAPHLVFDWNPAEALDPLVEALETEVTGRVQGAICPHGDGPPVCWCRPPLPGLPLAFAHQHHADPASSILIGTTTTHRRLATALGAHYTQAMTLSAPAGQ